MTSDSLSQMTLGKPRWAGHDTEYYACITMYTFLDGHYSFVVSRVLSI